MIVYIPIEELRPHPQNPRLTLREDVIESIMAGLDNGFHDAYALQVWPVNGYYFILSGHHRAEGAKRKGIEKVPCFVRADLNEEEAYMVLATANSQGELSPLEIGMHALRYVEKSSGGRGQRGGLSEYAARVGKSKQIVSRHAEAAAVVDKLSTQVDGLEVSALLDKAAHLAAIHKLPAECWAEAVAYMLKRELSARETAEAVARANNAGTTKRKLMVFLGKTTERELARIDELGQRVLDTLEFEDTRQEWTTWLATEDPCDIKAVQAKRIELETAESDRREMEADNDQIGNALPNLILADPPWRYDFAETDNRQIENQYPSATVDEIVEMRPETQGDAVLFLWATVAKLQEALEVMEGWGFSYKTGAVWDKEKIGMGYWFRGQHEFLLVGTRGQFSPPEQQHRVSSVFREPRGKHSAKPECVYQWIETAFPQSVKLEMFSRNPREGWKTWGNEA